jgi:sulfonate transport system substrate-binding protein
MTILARLAAACGLAALLLQPAAAAEKLDKLAVTYVTSPFNVPSIVMRAKGYLDEAFAPLGVKPAAPEITSGAQQVQALAAGEVQIASVLGSSSAILGQANGVDVKVIAAYSRNAEAYQILTRADGPKTVAELKGKTVAGPKGTVLHQLLGAALMKNNLKLADVDHINMDLPSARAALLAGKVDAVTLAGANALAVEAAGGRILVSGKGLIEPTLVIGVRGDLIKNHPEVIDAYLAAHRKALAFMKSNPDEALKLAADDQKISLDDARRTLAWYDFTLKLTDKDIANLNADQDFMIEAGMLKNRIDIAKDLIAPIALTLQ